MLPLEPTPAMLEAAEKTTGLSPEQLNAAYRALVHAWFVIAEADELVEKSADKSSAT